MIHKNLVAYLESIPKPDTSTEVNEAVAEG
jgi:hypothetical protein